MSKINDGGPALPHDGQANYTGGMTLRDYFAIHADIGPGPGMSAKAEEEFVGWKQPSFSTDPINHARWWAEYRAKLRYIEADAMLAGRDA